MLIVCIYVLSIVLANLSVAAFGPIVAPLNAFLFIGLDLTLRDKLHDSWAGRSLGPKMLTLIVVSGLLSYVLNPASGLIAVASVTAFIVSGLLDASIYQVLHRRGWLARSTGSNAVGALADSVIFPTIAFGAFLPAVVLAQFVAKVAGGFLWSLLIAAINQRTRSAA